MPLSMKKTKKRKKKTMNAGKLTRNNKHSESTIFSLRKPYGSERIIRPSALEIAQSRNRLGRMVPTPTNSGSIREKSIRMTSSRVRRNAVLQRVALKIKRKNPDERHRAGTFSATKNKAVTILDRGGVHIITSIGAIQLGMPPETIKDVLSSGLVKPKYYVVPKERFNLRLGVSCAEIEFPMFYSFFVKGTVMTLITDRKTEKEIDIIVRESTVGPEPSSLHALKEFNAESQHMMPNHVKEIEHFKVDKKMIDYRFFDERRIVNLTDESGGHVIVYDNEEGVCFEIFDFKAFNASLFRAEIMSRRGYYKGMSVHNLFFQLKTDGFDKTLTECFHIISYDSAEKIGNIYVRS